MNVRRLCLLALSILALGAADSTERGFGEDDLKGLAWRSVGPANMGGRVSAIALVPGSRTSFYVGYGTGGVFKTENLGTTFAPVFDKYPVLSIGALAVADASADWRGFTTEDRDRAQRDGKSMSELGAGRIVWVGTGEGNGRNSSSWGGGVYRSTDGGLSFTHLGLTQTHDIPRLALDPRDPDVCYVAALGHLWGHNLERGVFKTTDGGKSWQHVLKVDDKVGASDVVVDPAQPDTVYAALYARLRTPWSFTGNSEAGGIFRSDDAGKSWKKLAQGLPPRTGRIGLTIYPKDPRVLYAVVESDFGGAGREPFDNYSISGGLFRSADRGESWTRTTDLNFRPFYFSRVAVDPEDDQRVYLPGWDLAISDDGGRHFRGSGSEQVHVDFHAIVVNPVDPRQILVGNDGGVYVTHDRAQSWRLLDNVAAGQFYRVAVDSQDPYRIGGGLQDNGSWIGPSGTLFQTGDESKDGILNADWQMVHGGDGFTVAFDPEDSDLVYATSQGGYIARIRLDTNVKKLIRPSEREGQQRLRFNWDAPFLISPHDPSVLYMGGNKVFKLARRGEEYFAISDDLTRNLADKTATVGSDAETYGTVVSLAESPLRSGLLWAGSDDGLVHVTENEGKSWATVTPKEVGGLYVSRIAASRHDARTAYVAVDGHRSDVFRPILLRTADLGKSWKDIAGDLPPEGPVKVVLEDGASASVLYAGTEFGMYVTLDSGRHWVRMNGKSLPPVRVDDIVQHPRERDLVIGTHGRSIWVLEDSSIFAQLTPEVRNRPLTALSIRPGTPRLYAMRSYGSGHGIFRAKNPPLGTPINVWVREALGDPLKISIADAQGTVVRELDAVARPGLNRVVWDLQADKKHRLPRVEADMFDQTEFVPAGIYKVTVTLGEHKAEQTVEVRPAPGASAGS